MCGRYYFDIDEKELKEIVQEVEKNLNADFKPGEIYPTNMAPIITSQGSTLAKWGFPKWNSKGVIINARSEGLAGTKMFKNLIKTNRCIIPASGFYEWKIKFDNSKQKDKYYIKRPGSTLYMAGLFNTFTNNPEQINLFDIDMCEQLSYVIITIEANKYMAGIHDRMPLIFDKEEMTSWLNGENLDFLLHINNAALEHSIS